MSSPPGLDVILYVATAVGGGDRVDAVQPRIILRSLAGDPLAVGRPCPAAEGLSIGSDGGSVRSRRWPDRRNERPSHRRSRRPDLGPSGDQRGPSEGPSKNSCFSSLPSGVTVYVALSPSSGSPRTNRRPLSPDVSIDVDGVDTMSLFRAASGSTSRHTTEVERRGCQRDQNDPPAPCIPAFDRRCSVARTAREVERARPRMPIGMCPG